MVGEAQESSAERAPVDLIDTRLPGVNFLPISALIVCSLASARVWSKTVGHPKAASVLIHAHLPHFDNAATAAL